MRDTVDATIVEMDANGDGVADVRGARVAVAFTIPGERVRLRLPVRASSDRPARAALIEVLEPSPHRVAPPCPHFGPQPTRTPPCGGCAWQHIAYPEQLRIKTETVSRAVRAAVPDAPPVKPMLTATPDPWGFRHKVHFVFGDSGGRLTMGHLARGSRRVVPVEECRVHAGAGNAVAFALRDACRSRRRPRLGARQADPGGAARSGRARGPREPRDPGDAGRGPRPRSRAARRHATRARRRRGWRAAPERAPARRRDDLRRGHPEAARDRTPAGGRGRRLVPDFTDRLLPDQRRRRRTAGPAGAGGGAARCAGPRSLRRRRGCSR